MDVNKNAFLTKDKIKGLVDSTAKEQNLYSINQNDILITRTSETKKEIAYSSCLVENIDNCVFSGFLLRARPVDNVFINPIFMVYLLRSQSYRNKLIKISTETSRALINSKNLGSIKIKIPTKTLQAKISDILLKIDTRIECQSKIIEHYESLINSIIDLKIYNSNNNRETLKTYASLKNGYAFKSDNYNKNGKYKIVTIGNVTGDQYISDNTNNIDKIPFDIQRHQILKKNDILVSLTGNVGRVSMVNSDNCLLNQRVGLIQINNIEFRNYIYVVLSSHIFEREMVNKSQGAAQLNIGKNDVENYKMPKPTKTNLEISELIFKYLTKLSIEKRILKLFKDEKKYLLSNLFI